MAPLGKLDDLGTSAANKQLSRPRRKAGVPNNQSNSRAEPQNSKNDSLPLKLLNVNCQSIKNKINEFASILEVHQPDIVLGTESWLDASIPNSLIFPDGYEIYRHDRSLHGGGVFICVNNQLLLFLIMLMQIRNYYGVIFL